MYFTQGDPALTLKYETNSDLDDLPSLRREVERIWPVFRGNVEKSGLTNAMITAVEPRQRKWIFFYTARTYNFTLTQNANGTWHQYSWGRDYEAEAKPVAVKYLDALQGGDFLSAARSLHYPESFTPEKVAAEIRGISNVLQIITDELGTMSSYELNHRGIVYRFFYLQTASHEYWDTYPFFKSLIFDVNYAKKGNGYVIFTFSIINDKLVIHSVLFGLPADNPDSEAVLRRINDRAMREFG